VLYPNLYDLDPGPEIPELVRMIVEIPKNSTNKYEYDCHLGVFRLDRALYSPMHYPGDYGFIPRTLADDGDPIDVLVLMDEPAFPGCVLTCRLIGVIEGETVEDGGATRNDRLIGIETNTHTFAAIKTIDDLGDHFLEELKVFFSGYHQLSDHEYRVIAARGPRVARDHVEEAIKRAPSEARRPG